MGKIYNASGGYRKLHSFNFTVIVHLGTIRFCKRHIDWKEDPLGKTCGQMLGASRSGKQNIIEGSERAKTSCETEIKLIDVAKEVHSLPIPEEWAQDEDADGPLHRFARRPISAAHARRSVNRVLILMLFARETPR